MTFLRNLFQDLVEKRLWPVALALVAAAVAVPVALKQSEPKVTTVATARQPSEPPTALPGSPVSLDSGGFRDALSGTPLKDPFRQQFLPKPPKSITSQTQSSTTSSSSSGGTSGSSGSSGGGSSGGGGSGTTTSTTKAQLRFGISGGALKTYEIAPLTAIPSSANPVLIYLGLLKDGKTAAFLVSSDGTPQGDGTCSPSASVCQTLLMKAGDTEFLDLNKDSGAVQYELDMVKIVHG